MLYTLRQPVMAVNPVDFLYKNTRKGFCYFSYTLLTDSYTQTWTPWNPCKPLPDAKPCSTSSGKCSHESKWFSVVNFNVSKLYLFYWGKLVRCVIWGQMLTHLCCEKWKGLLCPVWHVKYLSTWWNGKADCDILLRPPASSLAWSPCTLNNSVYSTQRNTHYRFILLAFLCLWLCKSVCERDHNMGSLKSSTLRNVNLRESSLKNESFAIIYSPSRQCKPCTCRGSA